MALVHLVDVDVLEITGFSDFKLQNRMYIKCTLRVRLSAAAVSTGMGDRLRADKPPQYFTKLPNIGQLNLLSSAGRETSTSQSAASDALRLGVKAGKVHSTCG